MQVDASKIEMFVPQVHVLWDGMFQICGYMTILYTLIGWPCFAGLVIMIFAGPVQGIVMKQLFGINRKMVQHTDARVEATNEALQGIQSVKMQTWEKEIMDRIAGKRSEELKYLKSAAYLRGFSRAVRFQGAMDSHHFSKNQLTFLFVFHLYSTWVLYRVLWRLFPLLSMLSSAKIQIFRPLPSLLPWSRLTNFDSHYYSTQWRSHSWFKHKSVPLVLKSS